MQNYLSQSGEARDDKQEKKQEMLEVHEHTQKHLD
jgi:hypothetical protein